MSTALTLHLTRHAGERYRKRLRPGLALAAAAEELERLARAARLSLRPPSWLYGARREPDAYLVHGDVCPNV